ncbi:MAG: YraN family protein [Flavobacterium sp.]
MAINQDVGKEGEDAAVQFLIDLGYIILHRNYKGDKAEIDIVALFNNLLVIVEVKTRSSVDFILPQDAVNARKRKQLIKATNCYVEEFDRTEEVRLDIIAIHKKGNTFDIDHIEDAFYFF